MSDTDIDFLSEFYNYCYLYRNFSDNTCNSYQYDLKHFKEFLDNERNHVPLNQFSTEDVQEYLYNKCKDRAPKSISRQSNCLISCQRKRFQNCLMHLISEIRRKSETKP